MAETQKRPAEQPSFPSTTGDLPSRDVTQRPEAAGVRPPNVSKEQKHAERAKNREIRHQRKNEARLMSDALFAESKRHHKLYNPVDWARNYLEPLVTSNIRARRLYTAMRDNGVNIATHEFALAVLKKKGVGSLEEAIIHSKQISEASAKFQELANGSKTSEQRQKDLMIQEMAPVVGDMYDAVVKPILEDENLSSQEIRDKLEELGGQPGKEKLRDLATQEMADGLIVVAKNLKDLVRQGLVSDNKAFVQNLFLGTGDAAGMGKVYLARGALQAVQYLKNPVIAGMAAGAGFVFGLTPPGWAAVAGGVLIMAGVHYGKLRAERFQKRIEYTRGTLTPMPNMQDRNLLARLMSNASVDWNAYFTGSDATKRKEMLLAVSSRTALGTAFSVGFHLLGDHFRGSGVSQATDRVSANAHTQMADLARGGCFVGGTLILMADGTEKAIELVAVGEMVLSYDEETKEIQAQRVLGVQSPVHTHLVELTFSNGKKTRNTPNHRYLTKEKGWASVDPVLTQERDGVEAHKLEINDSVFAYLDGELTEVKIASITEITQETQTFNLSNIENTHTFFANGIVVHNVKLSQNPGTGDMGAPSPTPTSGESSLQQLLDEGKKVLKTIQDGASSGKEHTPLPPGDPGKLLTDFHHFLGDKLDPKNPDSGKIVDSDLSHLQQEVDSLHDPKLSHDFDTFMEHRASGTVTPDDTAQIVKDAEYLQVKPQIDAINTDIAEMRGAQDTETYGRLLSNLQNQVNELPPQYRGTFLADIHKAGLDVAISKTPDLDKLQQDLDILKATTDPNILHAGGAGDITALENANRYGVMVQNDLIEARHGNTLDFGDTNIYPDLAGLVGNRIDDALGHVGQTFDNVVGNTIHDHLPGGGGYAAEQAHAPTQIPTGHHLENLPVSGNQQVNLPAGWHVSGNTILDNHNQSVGTFNIHDGKVTFDPNSYAESTYGIPAGAETFPLEGIGQGPSLAEVGQYNPADWHWDTQISQPGLFSHNELTMSVDNGVVHYGGNLTGTNIPSHLDNIPIANDPNLQNIAAMNGGHIAPSDMVTAVRLNNGQVVLLPMSPDGSAHLPPELYSNGQLQNLNYISTAIVTGKDGQILHMGDFQHGLPDGAKIVSLASNPFQTPTTDAINHLNITGGNGAPQIIDLAKVIHTRVGGEGAGGGGGGGLPEVLGSFPGGAAGLAAAGGVIALASIPAARNVYRARTGGGSLSRFQRGIAIVGFPGSLAAVGAAAIHNRRAGRTAAAPTPAVAGATPAPVTTVTPPAAGTRLPAGLPASPNIYPVVSPQVANAAASLGTNPHDRGAARQIAEQLHIPREQVVQVAQAAETARNAHLAAGGGHHIEEAAGEFVRNAPTGIDLKDANQARIMAGILFPNISGNVDRLNYTADAIRRAAVVQEAVVNNVGDLDAIVRDAIAGMAASSIDATQDPTHTALQAIAMREVLMGQPGVLVPGAPPTLNVIRDAIIMGYEDAGALGPDLAVIAVATDDALRTLGYRVNEARARIQRAFEAAHISFVGTPSTAAETAAVAQALVAAYSSIRNYLGNNPTVNAENILEVLRSPVVTPPAVGIGLGASADIQGQVIAKMTTIPSQRRQLVRQAISSGGTFDIACEVARGLKTGGMDARDIQREVRAVPTIVAMPYQEAVLAGILADGGIEDQMKAAMTQIATDTRITSLVAPARATQIAFAIDRLRTILATPGAPVTLDQLRNTLQIPELSTLPAVVRQILAGHIYDNSISRHQTPEEAARFALTMSGLPDYGTGYTDEQINTYYSTVSYLHSTRTGAAGLDTAEIAIAEFGLDVAARGTIAARKLAIDVAGGIAPRSAIQDSLLGVITDVTTPEDLRDITQAMVAGVGRVPGWSASAGVRTAVTINTLCTTVGFGADDRERRAVVLGAFASGSIPAMLGSLGINTTAVTANPEYAAQVARGLTLSRATPADIRNIRNAFSAAVDDANRPQVAEQAYDLLSSIDTNAALALAVVASGVTDATPDSTIENVVAQLNVQGADYDAIRVAMAAVGFSSAKRESLLTNAITSAGVPNPATRDEINNAIARALAIAGCPAKITNSTDRNGAISAIRTAMPTFVTGSPSLVALNRALTALRTQLT